MKGYTTRLIHGSLSQNDSHKALRVPVYENASFEFASSSDIESAFLGRALAHSYSRISNPTVAELEKRVNEISEGFGTLALASGMAAISNVFLAIAQSGDNIITTGFLFGNTYSLLEQTLKRWGLETRYADLSDLETLESLIDGKTRAIFLETITNPQMAVFDIEALAGFAQAKGILLILDNTAATPYLFRSRKWGVSIEVLSSTKYISGGATSIGGLIIDYGNYDWSRNPALAGDYKKYGKNAFLVRLRREVYRNSGACLSPQSAYLQTLGLETLALRIDRSCSNAQALAKWLQRRKEIRAVYYPGLPESPHHKNAGKLLSAYGGIIAFEVEDKAAAFNFMDKLKIIRRATNIHDNKTLVIHPASTIYCEFSREQKEKLGVSEGLIRLSVGIEDLEDLQDDIAQAFGE